MRIIGAGLAGLLAGAMLRHKVTNIYEAQDALPNNHSAVLRFRSPVVGEVLNVPFKKVKAFKATHPWQNPVADALAYSAKTNGSHTLRSILSADGTLSERYIAPVNLIEQMHQTLQTAINFGQIIDDGIIAMAGPDSPVISTIPMPALMNILGWERSSEFRSRRGLNIVGTIAGAEAYCSLYVPDPLLPFSRISLTGDQLIVECTEDFLEEVDALPAIERPHKVRETLLSALHLMGLDGVELAYEAIPQKYAKILPIDEDERRAFIMWASTTHNIWSLGRFATWRPSLLLDDVVNDVRVIQRLVAKRGEAYHHNLKD
jgi:hypothetical protein